MSYTPIDDIPTGLRSQIQEIFDAAMAGFMTQLPTTIEQMNTANSEANASSIAAAASVAAAISQVALAATQAGNSATSAQQAAASATAADNTANATLWVSGQTIAAGVNKYSPLNYQTYRKITASSVTTTDPSLDTTNWVKVNNTSMLKVQRSSNTQLVAGDIGKYIEITSGTFTQTFAAASSLVSGWWCLYKNSGTGVVTLDPSGSELVNGLATWALNPNDFALIQNDGTGLSVEHFASSDFQEFNTSGTWTKKKGGTWALIELISGGAGGAWANTNGITGSAGGVYAWRIMRLADLPATVSVVVGAGGIGAVTVSTPGAAGGTTNFGSYLATAASASGTSTGGNAPGGAPGFTPVDASSYGALPKAYLAGQGGGIATASVPAAGQSCVKGGAGGGSAVSGTFGAAGVSDEGGNGGPGATTAAAAAGIAPGGGAGAVFSASGPGANGAAGRCRVTTF